MIYRLLFITDFTEQFAYRLLRGIIDFSQHSDQWVVSRMPPEFKRKLGFKGVVDWAVKWKADVVIGQFDPGDDVTLFRKHGIVALAQDYKKKFKEIPNITADYDLTGQMAAEHFLTKGFKNFAFFGYNNVCWSDERLAGFERRINRNGSGYELCVYSGQNLNQMWYYDSISLHRWIKSLPKPVAVFCCDDNQAALFLEACNACGARMPEEISVIGVDNDKVLDSMTNPTLSSIDVDIEKGGSEAAAMALRMLEDPSYKGEDIILHPISIESRMSTSVFATADKEVVTALQFIHANIDRKISVPDILKVVPLSRRLLETRFKKVTSETVYGYISKQRMERFASLLLETEKTVGEIAFLMDEVDSKSISRRFKEIKGCTPIEYRERNLRKLR